jgi:hypothetical protein
MEAAFGHRFGSVRVHEDVGAQALARSINAHAFTHGGHIFVGPGQNLGNGTNGHKLLAHELAHVVQQRSPSADAVQRAPEEQAAVAEATPAPDEPLALEGGATFERLEREEPEIARSLDRLNADYSRLMLDADRVFSDQGAYALRQGDTFTLRLAVEGAFVYGRDEITAKSNYDARHLSEWLQRIQRAVTALGPLLAAVGPGGGGRTRGLATQRRRVMEQVERLNETAFIQTGHELRERQRIAAAEQRPIDEAVEYLTDYVDRYWRSDLDDNVLRLYGYAVAGRLVHRMRLNGDQIRRVFDTLHAEDPELLTRALFGGGVVWALLEMGIPGFQSYRAPGEGLLAGFARGSRESLLTKQPGRRDFSAGEKFLAFAGFVAGVFQGIGDAIIDNVKSIFSLFTPKFWGDLVKFMRDELPKFVKDEEYRFSIGVLMGEMNADEVRRLAVAEPEEYGRTVGHTFGSALVEIVLMFIGLGWVLKAVQASPRLMRLAAPLLRIAQRLGQTAVIARGFRIIEAIREGIAALTKRLRLLLLRMTAITRGGKARLALAEAEYAVSEAIKRVEKLEERGRKVLASGDVEAAQRHAAEMENAVKELDDQVARWESQGAGVYEPHPDVVPETAPKPLGEEQRAAAVAQDLAKPKPAITPGHELSFGPDGQLVRCSEKCDLLAAQYKELLEADPTLKAKLDAIQKKAAQATSAGDAKLANEATQEAKELEWALHNREQARRAAEFDLETSAEVEAAFVEYEGPQDVPKPPLRKKPSTGLGAAARDAWEPRRGFFAQELGLPPGADVHHAIELQVLDRYPGVFSEAELNAFRNMRGIPLEVIKNPSTGSRFKQLHGSEIRAVWNRHYRKLDLEIARAVKAGEIAPGSYGYRKLVREYLLDGRDEIDHLLGQFFSEYRIAAPWLVKP